MLRRVHTNRGTSTTSSPIPTCSCEPYPPKQKQNSKAYNTLFSSIAHAFSRYAHQRRQWLCAHYTQAFTQTPQRLAPTDSSGHSAPSVVTPSPILKIGKQTKRPNGTKQCYRDQQHMIPANTNDVRGVHVMPSVGLAVNLNPQISGGFVYPRSQQLHQEKLEPPRKLGRTPRWETCLIPPTWFSSDGPTCSTPATSVLGDRSYPR